MFDETVLDDPDALARADTRELLRGAAQAGARLRTGARRAAEAGLSALRPEGRPRAVLVAGPGPAVACAADLLGALVNGAVPVTVLRATGPQADPGALQWSLPGWAGPVDLLLVATSDGTEAGLSSLVDQAYRRGCTVVAVCPTEAPLSGAIGQNHGLSVPLAPAPHVTSEPLLPVAAPGTLWAILAPFLILCDRLGLISAGEDGLDALADRLDGIAERCGPAVATYSNPSKSLAVELAGSHPLLWSEGRAAGAAARHAANTFTALAGRPALAGELPEVMALHEALLRSEWGGAPAEDDFFRDRVDESESLRARLVLLGEPDPGGQSALPAAREAAREHGTPVSELQPADECSPLETAAELIATADFAAVYLLLAAADA